MKINEIKNSTVDYDLREIAYWTSKGIEIEGKTYPIENFSIKDTGLFATIVLDNGQFSDHLIAGNASYDGGPTYAELATKAEQADLLITNQNVTTAQETANQAETDAQTAIAKATEAISTNNSRLLSIENRLAELENPPLH